MLSRLNFFSPLHLPNDRLVIRLFRKNLALSARKPDLASLLFDALAKLTGKVGQDGPPNQAAIRNW